MPMDFEVRASRRPLPRQLDVSDWNVDADVRNGNSSAMRSRERDWSSLRTESRVSTERWSAHTPVAPRDVTRPTNRYDMESNESYTHSSSDDVRRTEASRWSRELQQRQEGNNPRTDASQATSTRTPPRSLPSHQPRSLSRPVGVRDIGSNRRSSLYSEDLAHYGREETAVTSSDADESERYTSSSGTTYASTSVYETPVRRRLTFDDNQSDATTVIESPAFLRSVMDTPSTIVSSVQSTPERESHVDEDSSILSVNESLPCVESTPSEVIASISAPSSRIQPTEASSVSTDEAVASASVRRISATEQREQLYAFRRDMRQVFGRIDEMVDLHRDLFRSDPMSGIPDFDQDRASEAERFATDTFRQLSQLRSQFQELTTGWKKSEEAERAEPKRHVSRATTDSLRVTRVQHEDDESESNNSTLHDHRARPESPSTDSDESTTLSSHQELLRGIQARHRWEPSLSSLSSGSDSTLSRAAPVSPHAPSSIVRNEDAPARPRENVFGDFDRRMEEIRASLNAMARTRHSSTCPSATPKEPSYRASPSISSSSNENDVNESNHRRRPSFRDRDARLRHLLRELSREGSS